MKEYLHREHSLDLDFELLVALVNRSPGGLYGRDCWWYHLTVELKYRKRTLRRTYKVRTGRLSKPRPFCDNVTTTLKAHIRPYIKSYLILQTSIANSRLTLLSYHYFAYRVASIITLILRRFSSPPQPTIIILGTSSAKAQVVTQPCSPRQ